MRFGTIDSFFLVLRDRDRTKIAVVIRLFSDELEWVDTCYCFTF
jgi:hypothetical protein